MTSSSRQFPTIRLAGHRGFRDEAELRVYPLTLLYGRNQAGKSTLLRFLPLLGDSIAERRGPIDLTCPALRGMTFKELGWLGPGFSKTQRWALASPDGTELRIDIAEEETGPFVNALRLDEPNNPYAVDIRWAGFDGTHKYAGRVDGQEWSGSLSFDSLLPRTLLHHDESLEKVRTACACLERVQWIQANRVGAVTVTASRSTRCCTPDGSNLPILLQTRPEVVAKASGWLEQVGLGELRIHRDERGQPRFEVRVRPGWEWLPASMAGEGFRALLPIVLCALWGGQAGRDDHGPSLLCVEEPEAHLHPGLQLSLLDLLADTSAHLPVVLETHSPYLLMGMQRRILQGDLDPATVGLYWVEQGSDGASRLRRIEVRGDGSLAGWPPDVFEEHERLLREIFELRWRQESDVTGEWVGGSDVPGAAVE